jgi:hypothetical protein
VLGPGCAVVEVADAGSGHDAPFIGVAALDAAAGQILVGSWRDDEVRRNEEYMCGSELRPREPPGQVEKGKTSHR